jgi:hypothetical protein
VCQFLVRSNLTSLLTMETVNISFANRLRADKYSFTVRRMSDEQRA